MAPCSSIAFTDVLHEVPLLWDFMNAECCQVLLGANTELRKETHRRVTHISSKTGAQPANVSSLVNGGWSQLQILDLTWSNMTPAATAQLSKGAWPFLRTLCLARSYLYRSSCDANVFRQFKGKWRLLEHLVITLNRLDSASVIALADIHWPHLKTLCIEPSNAAMSALMKKNNWPQLKSLSLGSGLEEDGLVHLGDCPWSTLEELQLRDCTVTSIVMQHLIVAHFPKLTKISLVQIELHGVSSCALLAKGNWPHLTTLELCLTWAPDLERSFPQALATGYWPHLHTLMLEGLHVTDTNLPVLLTSSWPALKSLTLMGRFNSTDVLLLCMDKWPALQSLTIATNTANAAAIFPLAHSMWPSLQINCKVT